MPTPKLNLSLTVHEVNEIVAAIKEPRDYDRWNLHDSLDGYRNKDDGRVVDYRVEVAERALVKRDRLADLIELLTGEQAHDTADVRALVVEARKALDAQTAADQAAEEV